MIRVLNPDSMTPHLQQLLAHGLPKQPPSRSLAMLIFDARALLLS